jgi:exosortase
MNTPMTLRRRGILAALSFSLLTLAFANPLVRLLELALASELYSYIPAIPVLVGILLYERRKASPPVNAQDNTAAFGFLALGAIVLTAAYARGRAGTGDALTFAIASYLCFACAAGCLFLGSEWMKARAMALSVACFLIPLPERVVEWLEHLLVLGSAEVTTGLFLATGTPFLREGTEFSLPGVVIRVAQECSGIRSTWVLLITSIVASQLLLSSRSRRGMLLLLVLPIALLRNGFRILVIALLCVYVGPQMADSFIHRQGGPVFFVLSLIPMASAIILLRRSERTASGGRRPPEPD